MNFQSVRHQIDLVHRAITPEQREVAQRHLLEAGWFPGRSVDATPALEALRREGYDPPPNVIAFLEEFDGLHINWSSSDPFIDFDIATEWHCSPDECILEDLVELLGERVFPVGSFCVRHGTILLAESGRIFTEWDAQLWYLSEEPLEGVQLTAAKQAGTKLPFRPYLDDPGATEYAKRVAEIHQIERGVDAIGISPTYWPLANFLARNFSLGMNTSQYLCTLSLLENDIDDEEICQVMERMFLRENTKESLRAIRAGRVVDASAVEVLKKTLNMYGLPALLAERASKRADGSDQSSQESFDGK